LSDNPKKELELGAGHARELLDRGHGPTHPTGLLLGKSKVVSNMKTEYLLYAIWQF